MLRHVCSSPDMVIHGFQEVEVGSCEVLVPLPVAISLWFRLCQSPNNDCIQLVYLGLDHNHLPPHQMLHLLCFGHRTSGRQRRPQSANVCNIIQMPLRCTSCQFWYRRTWRNVCQQGLCVVGHYSQTWQHCRFLACDCEAVTYAIVIDICLSVCLSVCLSNAWIVTKRKHLAKNVQLWLIGSPIWAFQWA